MVVERIVPSGRRTIDVRAALVAAEVLAAGSWIGCRGVVGGGPAGSLCDNDVRSSGS